MPKGRGLLTNNTIVMAKKEQKKKIKVQDAEINLLIRESGEYVNLTDMARKFNERTDVVIQRWLRNRNTIEFLAIWEQLNNPDFNPTHLDGIRSDLSLNSYVLSSKQWISMTGAIGIEARAGRYGGTYAHTDIAMEFGTWLSPVFKMYLIKEFQRLKEEEAETKNLEWNIRRIMAKANYRIQTEAVRKHLIPPKLKSTKFEGKYYASEADVINVALFGLTARQWKAANPKKSGNMRDHATHEQLLVLSNLQSLNAKLMKWDCDQEQRLQILNESAIEEMNILISSQSLKGLPGDQPKKLK